MSTENTLPQNTKWRLYCTCVLGPISNRQGHIDGLVQDCSISIANTLAILQSCAKLSMCDTHNRFNTTQSRLGITLSALHKSHKRKQWHIDGLVQDSSSSNSSALTTELLPSCVKPSICWRQVIWWRHDIEKLSASLALCEGNPSVSGWFPINNNCTGFNVSLYLAWSICWTNRRVTGGLRHHDAPVKMLVKKSKLHLNCCQLDEPYGLAFLVTAKIMQWCSLSLEQVMNYLRVFFHCSIFWKKYCL